VKKFRSLVFSNVAGVEEKGIPDGLPAGRQARSREVLIETSSGGDESETGPAKK